MTEFRTKGKGNDRQVYPIRKKQPFGVPRKLAYEEVMALRQQGSSLVLNLKEDYPLSAMTRRLCPHGEKVEAIGRDVGRISSIIIMCDGSTLV